MFNELYINPAYAGYKESLYAHTSYRAQWLGVAGAPQTFVLGVDNMQRPQLNWGVQLYNDRIGLLNTTALMGSYAYRLHVSRTYKLAMGLSLGGIYTSIDASRLDGASESGTQDPLVANSKFSHFTPDVALGVYLSSVRWFLGISAQNLVAGSVGAPTASDYKLPQLRPSMLVSAGMIAYLSRSVKLKPTLLYKEDFAGPSSFDINAVVLLFNDRLWLGLGYRMAAALWKHSNMRGAAWLQSNALVGLVEFFASSRLRIGYSYDYSLVPVGIAGSGTHEVSIGFYVSKSTRPIYSPRYF